MKHFIAGFADAIVILAIPTTGLSGQESDYRRVEFSKPDSGIRGGKLPVNFTAFRVPSECPRADGTCKSFCIGFWLGKSLTA